MNEGEKADKKNKRRQGSSDNLGTSPISEIRPVSTV